MCFFGSVLCLFRVVQRHVILVHLYRMLFLQSSFDVVVAVAGALPSKCFGLSLSLFLALSNIQTVCSGDDVKERDREEERMAAKFCCLYDAPNKAHHCQPRIFPMEMFEYTATYCNPTTTEHFK